MSLSSSLDAQISAKVRVFMHCKFQLINYPAFRQDGVLVHNLIKVVPRLLGHFEAFL